MTDDFNLRIGDCEMRALQTPGHTIESICLVLTDHAQSAEPFAVLTGDTLFIGDVGRPDLSRKFTPQQLAAMLYDSLHNKVLKLPDSVKVYPAHGAGSLCGRNMRAERSSTIGTERLTNYALQIVTRDAFVSELTSHLPSRPDYFLEDAEINRTGAEPLAALPPMPELSPAIVADALREGVVVLDVRSSDEFAAAHLPGSINIALDGQFASWAGIVLGMQSEPVLVAESDERAQQARMRLARIGIDEVAGYLAGGIDAWRAAQQPLATLPQVEPAEVAALANASKCVVLDVRREAEFESGHISGAHWAALDGFRHGLPPLDRKQCIAVHCKGGYRSAIAASILQRAGYDVCNMIGGFDRWQQEKLPVVTGVAATAAK